MGAVGTRADSVMEQGCPRGACGVCVQACADRGQISQASGGSD